MEMWNGCSELYIHYTLDFWINNEFIWGNFHPSRGFFPINEVDCSLAMHLIGEKINVVVLPSMMVQEIAEKSAFHKAASFLVNSKNDMAMNPIRV
ncbi:hypothetical protein H8356DRAFT_1422354 [Neocallimastix lanati (nom. inval.)]|nr:hypothetical protein H8356DRAFT_1422354 [Neocallimastix sp. JGI-2020a]